MFVLSAHTACSRVKAIHNGGKGGGLAGWRVRGEGRGEDGRKGGREGAAGEVVWWHGNQGCENTAACLSPPQQFLSLSASAHTRP